MRPDDYEDKPEGRPFVLWVVWLFFGCLVWGVVYAVSVLLVEILT